MLRIDTATNKVVGEILLPGVVHEATLTLDGKFLYSWGIWGEFQGGFWGVHGMSVDQEGNVYTAAVDSGGAQKFTPRKGANPAFLLGKQVNPGWK